MRYTICHDQPLLRFVSWEGNPTLVPRVLDVVKGQLCFVIGTVYMEMSLKPNVLDDIARDVRGLPIIRLL